MSQTVSLKGQCIAEMLGTGLLVFLGLVVWLRIRSQALTLVSGKSV